MVVKLPNKLINKDKKQFAVFVPQHFSKQFFACAGRRYIVFLSSSFYRIRHDSAQTNDLK
ncbi:hypothetical protein CWO17_03715 [Vibrio sp. 10N.286.45.A3]|nr:hypothetical protein CWO17_03715 [Vibrio sp. 10N.286.45.A3]PTQ18345.1 hypothetical protein CWO24_23850 [Vibrio sp. 10N.286.46.E10]TKE87410.1 hypothetical protein FCV56_02400 [Vibrio sp. F12]TKE94112.1 hypothetical protein FCV53_03820 [Vibrio sp. F12]TKE97046.1 hypothetical protein FCV61_13780 [Vibrio sp. F12]